MFTGIIENLGSIEDISASGTNKSFWIASPISKELKVDQSVSHNGVCLTVEELQEGKHKVTAISETLNKTTLGDWQPRDLVNLERCLTLNDRLDGHFVQGHVDTTAFCIGKTELDGSWEFTFEFPAQFAELLIEKGSISLNGISLTVFNVTRQNFSVAIIPYTYEHTNMQQIKAGSLVNLEFDLIGKYISRRHELAAGQ